MYYISQHAFECLKVEISVRHGATESLGFFLCSITTVHFSLLLHLTLAALKISFMFTF